MLIFYCDPDSSGTTAAESGGKYEILRCISVQQAMNSLADSNPDAMVIRFRHGIPGLSTDLIQFCRFLRSTIKFHELKIAALVDWPNRELVNLLQESGINLLLYPGTSEVGDEFIERTAGMLSESSGINPGELCPYLSFEQFSGDQEICLCGADHNRLVISQDRMNRYCSGFNHHQCPFFLDPRGVRK